MEDIEKYVNDIFEKNKRQILAYPDSDSTSNVVFGLAEVEKNITDVFEKNRNPELVYHNLDHTRKVVSHAREISKHYLLNGKDLFIVECAAWFHDLGYLIRNESLGHELIGADFADGFLKNNPITSEIIVEVRSCIMATVLPQKPQTLLQKIICDADLYHFGTHDLFFQDALMYKEVELRLKQPIDERKWTEGTISLLESHNYHTEYCQRLLNQQKRSNLNKLGMILRSI